jgi:hypothetical protein
MGKRIKRICLSLEEVALYGGNKVLMGVVDNVLPIIGNSQGIIKQRLRPHPIHLFNSINIVIIINYIKLF